MLSDDFPGDAAGGRAGGWGVVPALPSWLSNKQETWLLAVTS